jgi:2-polyprenyl-6-methoxyphenol hydroxylase-like FAD-dependent oxidoreductase
LPLGQTTVEWYGQPYCHLHRADLLAALTAGVVEAGGEIRLGTRIEAVMPDGGGVRIAGEVADLVVAADGLRSGQRTARFPVQRASLHRPCRMARRRRPTGCRPTSFPMLPA